MTVRQEAYNLIDNLPEDSVRVVIEVMTRMMPVQKTAAKKNNVKRYSSSKMMAFRRMQELRQETKKYDIIDFDAERTAALEGKYGSF